jgi:hypothetical protein
MIRFFPQHYRRLPSVYGQRHRKAFTACKADLLAAFRQEPSDTKEKSDFLYNINY